MDEDLIERTDSKMLADLDINIVFHSKEELKNILPFKRDGRDF